MDDNESSGVAGMSNPEQEKVSVRNATGADREFIERELEKNNIDTETLDYREFIVAVEDGKIAGFGRLRKVGELQQIGCVVVVEDRRRRGVGSLIIKRLLESSSVSLVYVVTDLIGYFRKLGFSEMKEGSKELLDALDEACRIKGRPNAVIMVHEKKMT